LDALLEFSTVAAIISLYPGRFLQQMHLTFDKCLGEQLMPHTYDCAYTIDTYVRQLVGWTCSKP